MEANSEQELEQLLDEGKISQEEYQELKQAMAENNKSQAIEQNETEHKSNSIYKLGKIALVLTLGGITLPIQAQPNGRAFKHPSGLKPARCPLTSSLI